MRAVGAAAFGARQSAERDCFGNDEHGLQVVREMQPGLKSREPSTLALAARLFSFSSSASAFFKSSSVR